MRTRSRLEVKLQFPCYFAATSRVDSSTHNKTSCLVKITLLL